MTSVAADWVTLGDREFVGWSRLVDVRLPFPLSTGATGYGPAPERDEILRILAERGLSDSEVLETVRSAFAVPRLSVYAVRVGLDGAETKYLSIAGQHAAAVLVRLDAAKVTVRRIADIELAAGVVGALPTLRPMRFEPCEVTAAALQEIDRIAAGGASARTLRARLDRAGFSQELIAFRLQGEPGPSASGTLGALGYPDQDDEQGRPRHSTRSTNWREFDVGALLQIERGARRGEQTVLFTPGTSDALFRSAVDAVASVHAAS